MASKAQGRRKRKRPSATEWERRQRQRGAKWQRKRKGKSYNPARYLTRNQEEVAQRLLDGEVTTVCSASRAFFERFLVFLQEVGVFAVLDVDGARFYRQMIDLRLLIMTYGVKILLGIATITDRESSSNASVPRSSIVAVDRLYDGSIGVRVLQARLCRQTETNAQKHPG